MARQSELRVSSFTDTDGVARIGLMRVLLADATHAEETRTKGGIWTPLSDVAALTHARDMALAYAEACDTAARMAAAPAKPRSVAARKPVSPPPAPVAPAKKPAPAKQAAPVAPVKPDVAANRAIAIANARAAKPAPAPRVVNPAPAKDAGDELLDWLDMVRA